MEKNKKEPLLRVEHLSQYFPLGRRRELKAVNDVSFDVYKGEVFGLVGESGCGKTTTGRSIIKLYDITGGNVYFKGQRIGAGTRTYVVAIKEAEKEFRKLESELNKDSKEHPENAEANKAKIAEAKAKKDKIVHDNKVEIAKAKHDHDNCEKDFSRREVARVKEKYEPVLKEIKEEKRKKSRENTMFSGVETKKVVKASIVGFILLLVSALITGFLGISPIVNGFKDAIAEYFLMWQPTKYASPIDYIGVTLMIFDIFLLVIMLVFSIKNKKNILILSSFELFLGIAFIPFLLNLTYKHVLHGGNGFALVGLILALFINVFADIYLIIINRKQIGAFYNWLKDFCCGVEISEEHNEQLKAYKDELHKAKRAKVVTQIQMIFQDPIGSLNPRMTVQEIISEGLIIKGERDKKVIQEKVYEVLEKVGLVKEHATRYPHEFSGGQRQRIGIARSVVMNPEMIIADEPVSALDVSIQAQVINLLNDLRKEFGLTVLFIAHDLSVVKYFSDRIGVMYYGNLVELASSDEIFKHPLHPYTRSLLSAIPLPDPEYEKKRKRITYNPVAEHDYSEDKPSLREIVPGHFVYCNKEEEARYKKELANEAK